MKQIVSVSVCAAVMLLNAASGYAEVTIDYITVADPGNEGELSGAGAGGFGTNRICGAVASTYRIARYEVTNGQYIEFLNAVAATDAYGLYSAGMGGQFGGIARTGFLPGSYSYSAKGGDMNRLDRPVNYISFWKAARFANWLHNGQPSGVQDAGTTEDGAYTLNGQTGNAGRNIVRNAGARVFVPTEDEWYKAAYFEPQLNAGAGGYWNYPMQSNSAPTAELPPGSDMIAGSAGYWVGAYSIGPPYYTAEVGAYTTKPSDSPYGTYDQGGNQWEWVETLGSAFGPNRGLRGGSFYTWDTRLSAGYRVNVSPDFEDQERGFRVAAAVAEEPIPTVSQWGLVVMTLALLVVGTLLCARHGKWATRILPTVDLLSDEG